jgi:16S rRNA (uracil1498-N3)-methyltransferase
LPRFFAEIDNDDRAVITGRDVSHILGSLRKEVGDELAIRDQQRGYMARIISVNTKEISLEILYAQELAERSARLVHLGISLIDLKDMDVLIRSVTELGVSEIYPLIAKRSNVRDVGEKRADRWRQIIHEAIKQCERVKVPVLHEPMILEEFLEKTAPSWPCRLVASLSSDLSIRDFKDGNVGIIVGPEGGFTQDEMGGILASGFIPVHMGKTILRSCTAAMTAVGILAL